MTAWFRLARQKQLPTSVVGGAVRGEFVRVRPPRDGWPCHYCDFTSPDQSVTYAHLFACPANPVADRRRAERLA